MIEDHFDVSYELDNLLVERGKSEFLDLTRGWVPGPGQVTYLRQMEPLGLGHAVWCARRLIGDEPFAVILADDLILSDKPCLQQLADIYEIHKGCVVAVEEIDQDQTDRYGILDVDYDDGHTATIRGLVEKPPQDEAPSQLRIIGRYILQPLIFEYLSKQRVGTSGEIQITDAMARMIDEVPLLGVRIEGRTFDCGDKIGYIEANMAFALERKDLNSAVRQIINAYAKE